MRITDSHHHLWTADVMAALHAPAVLAHDYQPQHLRPLLDTAGVADTVLVQAFPQTLANTNDLLQLAEANPWIVGVVGWVDLADPTVGGVLDKLATFPRLRGIRHIWEDEPDPGWIMRPEVLRGLRAVASHNLTYDLLTRPPNWPYLAPVVRTVPDLRCVIDHIAKPDIRHHRLDDWWSVMVEMAQFPHLFVKLSGMVTEADHLHWQPADLRPYVLATIELFGVERVMFGSDWPVCLQAGSYQQVFDALQECLAPLTEAERAQVLGENARRFYGII